MIQLLKGSIFDSKCDLIIIPCDNLGGVTSRVLREIIENNLPSLRFYTKLDDIRFDGNVGNFSNASVIGYAPTVNVFGQLSTRQTVQHIVHRIKDYCNEQSLHKVNIPLLGSGAGGLSAKESFGIIRDAFADVLNITLCVYTFSDEIYYELSAEKEFIPDNPIRNPRVFISYTGMDLENRNWVKKFACRLRNSGIDARIDMFNLKPGQDLPQWMTNELIMADKVLLICDKYYAEKADSRNGGVGWETMIIQGDMLSHQEQNKYIAIIRDKNIDHCLPVYVKSKYALNWADESKVDSEFDELLLYLFDCDIEPPIGEIPTFVKNRLKGGMH